MHTALILAQFFVINIHEYSNDSVFISANKVGEICHSKLCTLRQLSIEISVILYLLL